MKIRFVLLFVIALSLACQVIPTPPPLKDTPPSRITIETAKAITAPETTSDPADILTPTSPTVLTPGEMLSFPYQKNDPFSLVEVSIWRTEQSLAKEIALPFSLKQVENPDVVSGLTTSQRNHLEENGFVVIHSRESQFADIRERVSSQYGQPYFLTSDAAFHALQLTFEELLAILEKEELHPRITAIVQSTLVEILSYYPLVQGTNLETDTHLTAAYLGVALKLLHPQITLEPYLEQQVNAQIEQIMTGTGIEESVLLPDIQDDYGAYIPIGHYSGEPELEAYFRGMTWLSRDHFESQITGPNSNPSRIPLIITLALRKAVIEEKLAAEEWALVQEVLTFFLGPNIFSGPPEYSELMDQVYGPGLTIIGLKDETNWQTFLSLSRNLPQQQNSPFIRSFFSFEPEQGWCFMNQHFNLDSIVMHNLIYEKVGTPQNPRQFPSGLDVMASLGSHTALKNLEANHDTDYENYSAQMGIIHNTITSIPSSTWLQDAHNSWLYTFLPLLEEKGSEYPAFMRTSAWAYKDLNSALGSWVELKHDKRLFTEIPESIKGEDVPVSGPAPCYVEPNPPVYYRLSYIAIAIAEGLKQRKMTGSDPINNNKLSDLINEIGRLGLRFQQLGDIAAKQLAGLSLDENDLMLCMAPLIPLGESINMHTTTVTSPMEVVASIASANEDILHVGIGLLDRIYVLVPLEGKIQIAQGGIFSYYEFKWPRHELITDIEWKHMLECSQPQRPKWTESFAFADGHPVDILAFRIADIYFITPAGNKLNLREAPTRSAKSIRELQRGEYLEIIDGPIDKEGFIWWKFNLIHSTDKTIQGWAVQNPEWYERAWGQ